MTSEERRAARYARRKEKREAKRQAAGAAIGGIDEVFSLEHLYRSYELCRKGVLWKASVQTYKAGALLHVYHARQALLRGSFQSRGFVEFDIFERGKPRHIRSVHISERVVQRCLCDHCLVPLLSRCFIYDNGACLRGKGMDFSIRRLKKHLRDHYRKHGTDGYVLLFDFQKFFDTANHEPILAGIERAVPNESLREQTAYFLHQFGSYGLGLGSQVSQICALALPNSLDHYIKEVLCIQGYGRYMDDGYLIHHSKAYLRRCLDAIRRKCRALGIALNEKKTQIIKITRGIQFLKHRFFFTDTGKLILRPCRKTVYRMERKLRIFCRWVRDGRMKIEDVVTSMASWRGHMMRSCSRSLVARVEQLFYTLFHTKEGCTCIA